MFPCQFYPAHCTKAMYPAEVPPTVAAPAGLPVGAWQPEGEEGGGSRVERRKRFKVEKWVERGLKGGWQRGWRGGRRGDWRGGWIGSGEEGGEEGG